MKNLILSCAVVCAASFVCINKARAQETKTRFGIKAGADLMTLGKSSAGGNAGSYDYRPGFQGGVYGIAPLGDKLDFTLQVLYTQKGGNIKESAAVGDEIFQSALKSQVNYLDVPLLVGFKLQPDLTVTLGPQVSFLLSQKTTLGGSGNSYTDTEGLRKVQIGGNLGVGYMINNNVGINLNYSIDFQHFEKENGIVLNPKERNSGFALTVGYLF